MPKLLVLFHANDDMAPALAEAVAEGARGVRFMEVETRSVGGVAGRVKAIESAADASSYDGIVVVSGAADVPSDIRALIHDLGASGKTKDMVFAAAGAGGAAALSAFAEQGAVIATVRRSGDDAADARVTGARAAKVVGWVHHALGHEAEHHHHSHHH